jgi:hypothetical protein
MLVDSYDLKVVLIGAFIQDFGVFERRHVKRL